MGSPLNKYPRDFDTHPLQQTDENKDDETLPPPYQLLLFTMTGPRDIAQSSLARAVSYSLSISPTNTFHSPPPSSALSSFMAGSLAHRASVAEVKQLKPFNAEEVKILLLENVNQTGRDILTAQGYQVESHKSSLPEAELIEKIK